MSDPVALELREQFATPEQQRETASAGMWIFLMTEVLMFGALFSAYTVYRILHPQGFALGSSEMDILLGSINTAILLTTSLMMAFAESNAQEGNERWLAICLIAVMLLGAVFLCVKVSEYVEHYHEHKAPGFWFEDSSPYANNVQLFFVFYFIMTGLHAVHMIIGIGIMAFLLFRTWVGSFSAQYHTPIVIGGLYWHFVDIVWIFLYAIFYLPGLHR
ncbi:MAG: cytochrome c oxidase subunit 3 [Acidobacteriaceae bacterium]|nr:cytochrome c oxidase subunit 3 [Acidobacteriaceae bacterium]